MRVATGTACILAISWLLVHSCNAFSLTVSRKAAKRADQDLLLALTHHASDNAVTSCIIHALVNASHLGMAVHELRYARARMTEEHLQKHYQTAFMTPEKDVAKPPLIKTSRPILTKCPSSDDSPQCAAMFECPCKMGKPMCYKLETCDVDTPENVRMKFVHFVRRPLDVVVASYMYNTQMPPPEEWMTVITMHQYAKWMVSVGVPRDRLQALACFATPNTTTYYEHLHGIDPVAGLELEFWRTGYELYDMARQAAWLSDVPSDSVLTVRVDQLEGRVMEEAQGLADFLQLQPVAKDGGGAMAQMVGNCEKDAAVGSLYKRARLGEGSVAPWPQGKEGATMQQLADTLMGVVHMRQRICELSRELGYLEVKYCK